MATYEYIAKTAGGEQVGGVMQADSEAAVVRTLDERELFPVRVMLHGPRAGAVRGRRVRARDIGVMYGQLGDLLRAGVPMLRALDILARTGANKRLSAVVVKVRDDVAAGRSLADAMAARPEAFLSLHAAMVRAGERGGFLEDVLTNLAEFLDRQDDLRSKVRGAMIYPAVLTGIGLAAMVFVLTALVPQFESVFGNMPLPAPTQVLFAVSRLLTEHWAVMLGVVVLVVVGCAALVRSEIGRELWERWRLRLPLLGKLARTVAITRFCRILGTMLANGVPILQSLAISKDAAGSKVLADSIEGATESVRAGEPLAQPLGDSGLFPVEIVEMIAVAEESNQLEKVLIQIADTVERRTNRQVDQTVRLIEPLILVVIAAGIGFIALGLLYPIFSMARTLE